MKKNVLNFLTNPGQLASKFDWKKASGSIMALDIGSDNKIGLAIASHPSYGETPMPLDPIPITLETKAKNRKCLSKSTIEELKSIVTNYNVCGFVIAWPMQREGRCGAPCGKVLHTLDSLIAESSAIVNTKRPFCLWDEHHYVPQEDVWGRIPLYGCPSNKTIHKASEEQYEHKCSSSIAVDVWNDFCAKHWPDLWKQEDDAGYQNQLQAEDCVTYINNDGWFDDDEQDEEEEYEYEALIR